MKAEYNISLNFIITYDGREPKEGVEALKPPTELADELAQFVCDEMTTPDIVANYEVKKAFVIVK